jgi:predicted alpha/beta hydrolase family esterase
MQKTRELSILIIPGFGESVSLRDYQEIKRRCEKAAPGAKVVLHQPKWSRRTAADWIKEATRSLERLGPENTYVIGFSLGAYVGLFLSERFQLLGASLCSVSPYFSEEMSCIPNFAKKIIGVRRVRDFSGRSSPQKLRVKPRFFFGDRDWPLGIKVAQRLAGRYGSQFSTINGAGHEFTPPYIDALVSEVKARLA